jgi:hypothetical protein
MVAAMFLAHLIGDYVLQWDGLARWKARALAGVLAHGAVVAAVTLVIAVLVDPQWWPWALTIGAVHTAIDTLPLWLFKRLAPLARLAVDQALHVTVIVAALAASGYLALPAVTAQVGGVLRDNRLMALALGYVFVTMPAWILVEFSVYGLLAGTPPDLTASNKYVGSLERGLITTCVMLGQFALVPVVALPRLVLEGPRVIGTPRTPVYVAEWLASVALAVAVGLSLRGL